MLSRLRLSMILDENRWIRQRLADCGVQDAYSMGSRRRLGRLLEPLISCSPMA
jgi:hypothetical protein